MSDTKTGRLIHMPNMLKLKIGGRGMALDNSVIARAEAALKGLSGQFGQWMQDELDKLDVARAEIDAKGVNETTLDGVYMRAHDLKGLGATYEYPLVTRIAASLCRLIDEPEKRAKAPLFLVDAHISAIKAMVRDTIQDPEHPVGKALVSELEAGVARQLAATSA